MKILVFDSNSILNRAFYGIKLLTAKDGSFTNAVYGFFNITLKLIDDQKPDCVAFAFDLKAPTFRHKMFDGYKAQRKGMPPELAQQLPVVKELITSLGYPILEMEGYEADDILGTVAKKGASEGDSILLATGDRDSLQLVNDNVTVILASTRAGGAEYIPMTPEAVKEKYGVEPAQLVETKALMGDSSDNIPGVAGIGEKTAFALIQKYGTVERLYEDIEGLEATASVKKKLEAGREMAMLSRQLGEIFCEVPIGDCHNACARKEPDNDALYTTLSRLELHSLIKRLGVTPPVGGATPTAEGDKQGPATKLAFVGSGSCTLTMSTDETPLYFVSSSVGSEIKQVSVVTDNHVYLVELPTQDFLNHLYTLPNPKWMDDSKQYYKNALAAGVELENVAFDVRLAGYLLSPNSTEYTVERLMGEYGVNRPAIEGCEGEVPALVEQATGMPGLCLALQERIDRNNQHDLLFDVEMPLALVLASMEQEGFRIDLEGLKAFGDELDALIKEQEAAVYQMAGRKFNLNSPKQLGEVLFDELGLPVRRKTKSGYSTDAEVLESLRPHHEIIGRILDYRKYAKLKSTYVEGLAKAAGEDSIIRTSFNQTETRTGRISSTEPNMQNIPIRTEPGSRMRRFFTAREGNVLIDADYSQIELRVLAAIAKDENMIGAFLSGEDIHLNTASQVFDLPPLFVTPLMRSRAKAVNFGIVYGISAFSLSKDIGVTVAEADTYIKNYLKTYSGVANYMKQTVEEAKEQGYVTTLFGRRRYLPELQSSNRNLRAFGERVAMNMPIQGTAADIIKIAMVRVHRRLKHENLKAKLILQVHDELIVEAPQAEAEAVRLLLGEEMERAVSLAVPMEADVKVGKNWQEAH